MVGEIGAALSSLKMAVDIVKAMNDLRNWQTAQPKIIELQHTILNAQSCLFAANEERAALIERIGKLEKQITDLENWDSEKQRYELTDIGDGTFAYAVKPSMRDGTPPHYLCTNCYNNRKASILSHMRTSSMGDLLTCPACGAKMLITWGYRAPE